MKKFLIILSIIAVAVSGGYKSEALAASQSEGAIPQSGDPCGGTGGNGQIVNVGNSDFTIKRHDTGNDQAIHLTGRATIKTSTGYISVSGLKIGDHVTLVGGPNPDGSFTANTVAVCTGTQNQPAQRQVADFNKANMWSSRMKTSAVLLVGLIWIGIFAFLRLKKKKSLVYLLFFTILYVYIGMVLNYTLFQFQSLIVLKHFVPSLMLNGQEAGKTINLIPLIALTLEDVKTSLLNILLMIPFGFGLPFIANLRIKKIVVIGALFSIGIELLQLISGLMAKITFRVADINDVIFNTLGVAIGYILFVTLMRVYRRLSRNWKISANPILRYIAERAQVDK